MANCDSALINCAVLALAARAEWRRLRPTIVKFRLMPRLVSRTDERRNSRCTSPSPSIAPKLRELGTGVVNAPKFASR